MPESFDQYQTFDESALEQLHELQVEGEPSFVGGLITDYLVQVQDLNEKIQSFEKNGDKTGLERAAHKLKSSSAVLGLAKLAAICYAIEEGARAGRPTATLVQAIELAVPESVSRLQSYLATLK